MRLHIALIILYLLFTCPRSTITCVQGVFSTSSRRTVVDAALSNSDIAYAVLESVSELAQSAYQASLLPLLASYHYNFRRIMVNSSRCCCRCARPRRGLVNDNSSTALTTLTATHANARKSVTFDLQAIEFEIQY